MMISNPAFLNAAFSLNKGELSSLVETPQGYAIIFDADKKEPETSPIRECRGTGPQRLYQAMQVEAMAKEAADRNAVRP